MYIVFWVWNSSNAGELVTVQSGVSGGAQPPSWIMPSSSLLKVMKWRHRRMEQSREVEAAKAQKHQGTTLASTGIAAPTVEGESTWTSVIPWEAWQRVFTVFSPLYVRVKCWQRNLRCIKQNLFIYLVGWRQNIRLFRQFHQYQYWDPCNSSYFDFFLLVHLLLFRGTLFRPLDIWKYMVFSVKNK